MLSSCSLNQIRMKPFIDLLMTCNEPTFGIGIGLTMYTHNPNVGPNPLHPPVLTHGVPQWDALPGPHSGHSMGWVMPYGVEPGF